VYRLITKDTYEWEMFDRSSRKLGLDHAVLANINDKADLSSKKSDSISKGDINNLLKNGAYSLLNKEYNEFCEENIDEILEKSRKIVIDPTKQNPYLSNFSKAVFESDLSKENPELDDPNFWEKILPNRTKKKNSLILDRPRKRRQVKTYNVGDEGASSGSEFDEPQTQIENGKEAITLVQDKKCWSIQERSRLKKALLQFGYGRWGEIATRSTLKRPLREIADFSRAFVDSCLIQVEKEERERYIEIIVESINDDPLIDALPDEGETRKISVKSEPSLSSKRHVEYFQRHAKEILITLETVARIRGVIRNTLNGMIIFFLKKSSVD